MRVRVPCRRVAVAGGDGSPQRVEHGALTVREPDKHPAQRLELETEPLQRSATSIPSRIERRPAA